MTTPYSHLYNAVILPAGARVPAEETRYQVSASRNDRETPRYVSPAWTLQELRSAFHTMGTSELEFQELLRGNRRGAGGREARRILFTAGQLESVGLMEDSPASVPYPEGTHPSQGEHAVFPEG